MSVPALSMSGSQIVTSENMPFGRGATAAPSYQLRTNSLPAACLQPPRRGSVALAAIGLRKKSEIDIVLDGDSEFVHSYSTYDQINGRVNIKFEKDTSFDEVTIVFEGQSNTYVERMASTSPTTGRTTGRHTFLRVQQPINDGLLPHDKLFLANKTYSIPFTFVVPDRLLPFICTHKVDSPAVQCEHLHLPPSLGDPSVSGDGHVLMDDMAPDMAKIVYAIRARITKLNAVGRSLELADRSERIRIVPARTEAPPLDIEEMLSDHVLRKEKAVKKGLFKIGKVGRLTAETSQPKSLHLPHVGQRQTEPVSTMATINMRFDPASLDDQPPALDSIGSKLKVYTFFGAAPQVSMPQAKRIDNWSMLHGLYPESVTLSSRNLSTVQWVRHAPGSNSERGSISSSNLSRRPSAFSTTSSASIPEPSSAYSPELPFYTASILVPIALPSPSATSRGPKVFVPTFHACIVSRTYSLELTVAYKPPGNLSQHVTLRSPLQISSDAGVPPALLSGPADAEILAEIEAQFGLYEARQADDLGLGLESPVYTDVDEREPLVQGTRHLSLDGIGVGRGGGGVGNGIGDGGAAVANQAPPEYRAQVVRAGQPRTSSVSVSA